MWKDILNYAMNNSDYVSFNILFEDERLKKMITDFNGIIKTVDKEYQSGKSVFFPISEKISAFLIKKEFNDWINFCVEDPSFWKDDREFVATISHEGYIMFNIEEKEKKYFADIGLMTFKVRQRI